MGQIVVNVVFVTTQRYPTDLTDGQWVIIQHLIPTAKPGGRPRSLDMRQVVNAILYLTVSGVQWRMLPKIRRGRVSTPTFAGGEMTVPGSGFTTRCGPRFAAAKDGTNAQLPIDSQTVKTGVNPMGVRGFDGGKVTTGRKRHILVDTSGLILLVLVTAASVQDRDGARMLLARLAGFCKKLRLIWVDGAYRGALQDWVAQRFRFRLQPVIPPRGQKGFTVLARRWVVERTFAWLGLNGRLQRLRTAARQQ